MRAAVYVRISSDPEGRALGVERQEEDCRALAASRGWEVGDVYRDNDVSASGRKRRPEWERLLDDAEAGRIEALVAYSSSRLYRNLRDLTRLLDVAEARGLTIATVASGAVNVDTADGRMLARILASVDQAEWERVSERVKRSHRQGAEAGRWHGRPGYGYDSTGDIVPAEAEVIRKAAERRLNGESWSTIARALSTPERRWNAGHLQRAVIAPRVAGLRTHRGELHPAAWEPILDRRTWSALADDAAGRRVGPMPKGRYLLTGLARCGLCGSQLAGHPQTVPTYACIKAKGGCGKVRVTAARLEGYVTFRALSMPAPPERHVVEPDDALRALQTEAEGLETKLADAYRMSVDEGWSPTRYQSTVKPWRARLGDVEESIEAALATAQPKAPEPVEPEVEALASLVAGKWGTDELPFEELFDAETWSQLTADPRTRANVRATIERRVEAVTVRASKPGGRWRSVGERVDISWRAGVTKA